MSDIYYTVDFGVNYAKNNHEKMKQTMDRAWDSGVGKIVCISNNIKETKMNMKHSLKYSVYKFPGIKDPVSGGFQDPVDKSGGFQDPVDKSGGFQDPVDKFQDITVNMFHYTAGIHPHNASQYKEGDLDIIRKALKDKRCFGIGECGLDYNRMFSKKEDQIKVFRKQVSLAKETNSKLYIHCRDSENSSDVTKNHDFSKSNLTIVKDSSNAVKDSSNAVKSNLTIINDIKDSNAYDDLINILYEYNFLKGNEFTGLIHVFYGSLERALEFISLGFKLGITGVIFDKRRNKDLVKVIKSNEIKLEDLIVETDAPYLGQPGKKSEPSDTGYIVEEIARLKNMNAVQCGQEIYENSLKFLEIP
jgi:TatD DNase family protein